MSAEYSVEEALTMIDRIAIAYGSQELEDARAVLAERIKADRGMVPDSMIVLLNHIEGLMDSGILPEDVIPVNMWNAVSMHNITHPPAQAAKVPEGFEFNLECADAALRKLAAIHPITPPEAACIKAVIVGAKALLTGPTAEPVPNEDVVLHAIEADSSAAAD